MEDRKQIITSSGVKLSPPARRVVERHIEKWIEREQNLLFCPQKAGYTIYLDKEGDHCFTCQIEIQIGFRVWSGLDEGHSIQEAVLNALKHLKLKDRWEVYRPIPLPTAFRITA